MIMLMDNSCEIVGFRNDPLFVLSRKKWAGMMDGGKEGGREGGREGGGREGGADWDFQLSRY